MTALRAGFAAREITPPLGLPLGGYGARVGGADSVLDPLFCRAAVLFDSRADPVALVVLDLLHVFGDWVARVRNLIGESAGIAPERTLIAATHTHAGPGVFLSSVERDGRIAAYEEALADMVAGCVEAAAGGAQLAQLRFGAATASGVAANRRDSARTVDETVRVLSVHREGRLLGAIANFACHPTVLSADNHAYSGDLLGAAAKVAEGVLGAPVLLTNGAAGDVSTRFTRREQTHAEAVRLGRLVAAAIAGAIGESRVLSESSTPVAAASETMAIRWRPLPAADAAAAQLQAAIADVTVARERGLGPGALRSAQSRVEGAQAEWWIATQGGWHALFGPRQPAAPLQALRCGDIAIIAAPGELFSDAGSFIQRDLGGRSLLVGYANDYLGYFVPPADAAAGGYEALIAMVEPTCEPEIRSGLLRLAHAAGCASREPRNG